MFSGTPALFNGLDIRQQITLKIGKIQTDHSIPNAKAT